MTLEQLVKEMNFKGHIVVQLMQDSYWNPVGSCTSENVSSKWFRHLQPCDCRIVDGVLIFRCVR